jgi:phage protein D/phage baseplate assembly protein gpV
MSEIRTLPQVFVEVDGARLRSDHLRMLGEIRVQQRLSMPALCELAFFESAGSIGGEPPAQVGASVKVAVRGESDPLFSGQATAVEYVYDSSHGREVRVRAYDLLHQLRKRQPVRAHVQVTLADLARQLVSDLGFSVEAAEPGPLCRRWIQYRQSDLDLLAELSDRYGLFFTLRGDVLHLTTLEGLGDAIPLTLGDSLFEARVELNADSSCRSVSAEGWDPFRVEKHAGLAETPRLGRELSEDASPAKVGSDGKWTLVDEAVQSDGEAEALAQGELDRRVGQEAVLWGVARGNPNLRPGALVEVNGVAAPVSGRYVITYVIHTIDADQAFLSEFSTAPPLACSRPRATTAALGLVTRIDDPDHLGRVCLSLPTYGGVETDWLEVMANGAGAKKGLTVLPDVGDRVLVLFARGDPAQGIVLGGLYGAEGPPDAGVEATAVRRYTFLTRGGQRIRLDDTRGAIRFENSEGSHVELTPDKIVLHARGDIEIEAPGRSIQIRGKAINFERA